MKNLLTESENIRHEYCCTVVRIQELKPIEGKDKIVSTLVNGLSMVVRKDQVKEGDLMIYAMNETQLSEKFLSSNNLYEIGCYEKNSNAVEVGKLLFEGKNDEAKQHVGFFNKYGRVKLIRLGGVPSFGYLFSLNELAKAYPDVKDVNLEEMVDQDFDTVCGEEFVKVYMPPVKDGTPRGSKMARAQRKLKKFDKLIPGQFAFHYETSQLARCIHNIKPTDNVTISVKADGTSMICANVKVKKSKWRGFYSKIIQYLPKFLQFTYEDYDLIYSSRKVIINNDINPNKGIGWDGGSVQKAIAEMAKIIGELVPKGFTIYGEIVGYYNETNKAIQCRGGKDYDYGCPVGTNKLMIYRMTSESENGTKVEWNVMDICAWVENLVQTNPSIKPYIFPLPILYHGTLADMYPEIDVANHWHENVLDAMKNDKKTLGMEMNEPLCRTKVPREGIVLRIDDDAVSEAFKLKCTNYLLVEGRDVSNAETNCDYSDPEL